MASLFGAVAAEVGEGMQENVADSRENKKLEAERLHDMQLQNMRMKHDRELQSQRLGAEEKRDARRREADAISQDVLIGANEKEAEADRTFKSEQSGLDRETEMDRTQLQEESDVLQTLIATYASSANKSRLSGNGWKVEFDREQTFDPETGQPVLNEFVNATGPSGRPYRIVGDKAFQAGETDMRVYPFRSIEEQRTAEKSLYSGKVSAEQFKDDFGYVPSGYIFGKVTREDQGFRNFAEQSGVRLPTFMINPTNNRRRGDDALKDDTEDLMPGSAEPAPEVTTGALTQGQNLAMGGNGVLNDSDVQDLIARVSGAPSVR